MNDELFYSTRDLGLATTLSLQFPIVELNRNNPKEVFFIFKNTAKLKKLVDEYWLKSVRVEPQVFLSQIRSLKAAIYAE